MNPVPTETAAAPPDLTVREQLLRTDGRTRSCSSRSTNVGPMERCVSIGLGAGLALAGLTRGKGTGLLLAGLGGGLLYRGITGHCHGYEALGINSAHHPPATAVPAQEGARAESIVTIHRSPQELYAHWREFENLVEVMPHLKRVEEIDGRRSRWIAQGPMGREIEWEAEIITDREGEVISWRSLPGGDMETAGSVRFEQLPRDRGTAVHVALKYNPPAGKVGIALASLLGGDLESQLADGLKRLKSRLETGDVATVDGQPRAHA